MTADDLRERIEELLQQIDTLTDEKDYLGGENMALQVELSDMIASGGPNSGGCSECGMSGVVIECSSCGAKKGR